MGLAFILQNTKKNKKEQKNFPKTPQTTLLRSGFLKIRMVKFLLICIISQNMKFLYCLVKVCR